MKKIAVMSDTHWSDWDNSDPITQKLIEYLRAGYDQIWHAGDVTGGEVLETLEAIYPVVCVKGNCDQFLYRHLPHAVTETIEEVKVGMIHGWDLPLGHAPTVVSRFAADVDIVIHGHTHLRRRQEVTNAEGRKVTILNPGSVSSPKGGETPGFGELAIDGALWEYRGLSLEV